MDYVISGNEVLLDGTHFKDLEVNMVEVNNLNEIQISHKVYNLDNMDYEMDIEYNELNFNYYIGNTLESENMVNGKIILTSTQRGHILIKVDEEEYQFYRATPNDNWLPYKPTNDENIHENTTTNEEELIGRTKVLKEMKEAQLQLEDALNRIEVLESIINSQEA